MYVLQGNSHISTASIFFRCTEVKPNGFMQLTDIAPNMYLDVHVLLKIILSKLLTSVSSHYVSLVRKASCGKCRGLGIILV